MTRVDARVQLFAGLFAALAGVLDAIGFIRSGGFYVSFMSGNSTQLGVGIVRHLDEALLAAGLILAFLVGVVGGSLVGFGASDRRRPAVVLTAIAAVLASAALLVDIPAASVALVAVAMGAANIVFERDGRVQFGLTYMTGNLVHVGTGIAKALAGRGGIAWLGTALLWIAFVLGAALGAAAHSAIAGECLWLASLAALLLALASLRLFR